MKILYLTHSLHMGGVEKNLLLLSEVLIKNGHIIFVGARDGVVRGMLEEMGVCYKSYRFNLRSVICLWKDSFQMIRQIEAIRPDVIHSFSAASSVVLYFSKVLYHLKAWFNPKVKFPVSVSSIMGLQNSENENVIITQIRNYLTIFGTKRTFIISPKIDSFVRKLPVKRLRLKNLNVVGIKKPEFQINESRKKNIRKALGVPDKNRVIITIGHLHPRKSHDLFIKMAECVLRMRDDVTFLIVGDGPLKDKLEKQILQTEHFDSIKLLGLRNDIYELLSISDVCVKPGIVEGFIGITVLEAQILLVPVIAFDTVDVQLAIKDRETGILSPLKNVERMAEDICSLLNDYQFAKEIAGKGRDLVSKIFTIDAVAANLVKAYFDELV